MPDGPRHEIADLRCSPGELHFEARLHGAPPRTVVFRTDSDLIPTADAALATCLMPAMRTGGALTMSDPVSARIMRNQREFQAIQSAWSFDWPFGDPPLHEVEVSAPVRDEARRPPVGRVAAFFSGGVDSFSTVLENLDVTDLIFVHGLDVLPWLPHQLAVRGMIEERIREAASELELPLHVVETDLRLLTDPLTRWEIYFGCATAAVALFMAPLFDRILIAGDSDYEVQEKIGANFLVDRLWETENVEIIEDGGRLSRMERIARMAGNPVMRKTLRTCWRNPDGAYNCGRCRKCLMTMAALEAVGELEAVETFPSEIDVSAFGEEEINQEVSLTMWEDLLDALREAGKPDLERATAAVIAKGRQRFGLAADYRRRHGKPDAPVGGAQIYSTPETMRELGGADAVAVLVGSYDGSGNFGDIAQLDATLQVLDRLEPGLMALPIVELAHAEDHAELAEQMLSRFPVLYFDPTRRGAEGLVPVDPPPKLGFAVSYLYGGGYLNRLWGDRKLAMLRAGESLFRQSGPICRISSGIQAEADWIEELDPSDKRLLRSFALLGARDGGSIRALRRVGTSSLVLDTGDDAIGLLGSLPAASQTGDGVQVAVHFAEHDFATDEPGPFLRLFVELLDQLRGLSGGALSVLPLMAYVDRRMNERPGLAELRAACAERDIEIGEGLLLLPAGLADAAVEIGRSSLTLSCSYHVALTSLMLGVPTVLVEDNPYYEQKAAGLREAFALPPDFTASSETDPVQLARTLAETVFDPDRGAALRESLRPGADRLRRRRTETEARLLGTIGGAALGALGAGPNGNGDSDSEQRLAELLGSRSWQLTKPLRRLGTLLRRH